MKEHRAPLNFVAVEPKGMAWGDDGELYHLPTLWRLLCAGRLHHDSAGYRLLKLHSVPTQTRLIA
ncbi:hypothetical protein ACI3L1_18225 [Deinococcus sp. SM5_A1]|uniref:hypothetical protein n=1 Tax=Deinococcus sp. SM5_A1 TaxID=3379094 RepID=UPI00385E54AE